MLAIGASGETKKDSADGHKHTHTFWWHMHNTKLSAVCEWVNQCDLGSIAQVKLICAQVFWLGYAGMAGRDCLHYLSRRCVAQVWSVVWAGTQIICSRVLCLANRFYYGSGGGHCGQRHRRVSESKERMKKEICGRYYGCEESDRENENGQEGKTRGRVHTCATKPRGNWTEQTKDLPLRRIECLLRWSATASPTIRMVLFVLVCSPWQITQSA